MNVKRSHSVALLLCLCGTALGQSVFEPGPGQRVNRPAPSPTPAEAAITKPADTAAAELGFVIGASQHTMQAKYQDAIAMLGKAMEAASSSGQTALYEALKTKRAEFEQLEERLMAERLPPSIYPLELGKKGCLMAIREVQLPINVEEAEPMQAKMQMVSWFHLKVTASNGASLAEAETFDATGRVRLYRVKIDGPCAAQLQPGSAVRIKNSVFQCTSEEGEGANKVYSLKQLDLASFLKQPN